MLKKIALFLLIGTAFFWQGAQNQCIITGKVTSRINGDPIAGAIIQVKGTAITSLSDQYGYYSITAPDCKAILIFESPGFSHKEIRLSGAKTADVALEIAPIEEEIEIVGDQISAPAVINPGGKLSRVFHKNQQGTVMYSYPQSINGNPGRFNHESDPGYNTEDYDIINENRFLETTQNPLSTFSIDVDAASYSNLRRFIQNGQTPPADAVRIEEMVNYFNYDYPQPGGEDPFTITGEISDCPWNPDHRLVQIGMQGRRIESEHLPPSNLVFLIDVSGSMDQPNKLPLLQSSFKLLANQLRERDRVAIVVYAGAAGTVLPSTSGSDRQKIKAAIEELRAGGSTAGAAGIKLAYQVARDNFIKNGNNRVILATDGDFNVGVSSDAELVRMIEEERNSGVFLTVLGFGMGNYKDNKMQQLADKGNGNHAYIDNINEAKKVLVSEIGGTLYTIAKDVKIQVEFNPAHVQGYRLIGYENRMLNKEDFNDDKKDAGELGAGHTVTALYEIIPSGIESTFLAKVDDLKYQATPSKPTDRYKKELLTIKARYKKPEGHKSILVDVPLVDGHQKLSKSSENFRFAAAVAQFGMLLRNSEFKANANYANAIELAKGAKGDDPNGYRKELIDMMETMQSLTTEVIAKDQRK